MFRWLGIFVLCCLFVAGLIVLMKQYPAQAVTPWPSASKAAYIERCTNSLSQQGLSASIAQTYCACITNGMEQKFGMEEYKEMMQAQPSPSGSTADRKMYEIMNSCSSNMPK